MKKIIFIIVIMITVTVLFIRLEHEPIVKDKKTSIDHIAAIDEDNQGLRQTNQPIVKQVAAMSLDEKIGQLIIGGFSRTVVTDATKKLMQTYKLGGFILFQRNLETAEQSLELVNQLKRENNKNDIPLFLSVDQEGGNVTRLPEIRESMTNKEIGHLNNKNKSYEVGRALGRQLSAYGMNLNFAPVLDVNNNPHNVVIGDRSFSNDPTIVSTLGVQMMKGMQAENIIPVIKHFPGHGDTHIDSHESLPVIDKRIDELEAVELRPFKDAIDAGADVVMTGHIHLPQLETDFPATLSKKVIVELLREQFNFEGVVVTDDITMGAISNHYGLAEAAVLAIKSGIDIVLVAHEYESIVTIFNGIKKAVQTGDIKEDRIDESVTRVLQVKHKYGLDDEEKREINVNDLNEEINDLYAQ